MFTGVGGISQDFLQKQAGIGQLCLLRDTSNKNLRLTNRVKNGGMTRKDNTSITLRAEA